MPWSTRILRIGMAVFVAAFAGLVCADPPTTATNAIGLGDGYGYVGFELETPYAPGPNDGYYRVSGTNCNFNVETLAVCHDGALMWVAESSLTIGGETVTLPSGFDGGSIRFASTHFADSNDDLVVVWKAKFAYEDPVHNFSGTSDWVTVEFHLDPYNKAFFMGTILGPTGTQPNPVFAAHTKSSAVIANTALASLGHTCVPATDDAIIAQTEGNALVYAETQTAFFAMVHGAPNRFNDSTNNHNDPSQDGLIVIDDETSPTETGEIKAATGGRTGNHVPRFSTMVFYACGLYPENSDPHSPWNPQTVDSCFLGFPVPIGLKLKLEVTDPIEVVPPTDPVPDWIDSHVEILYEKWGSDETAQNAVVRANEDAMPRGTPYYDQGSWWIPPVEMKLKGDDRTTIHWVYLTLAEAFGSSSEEAQNWYRVWSN